MKSIRVIIQYLLSILIFFDYYSVYWMLCKNIYGDRILYFVNASILFVFVILGRDNPVSNLQKSNITCSIILFSILFFFGPDFYTWFFLFIVIVPLFSLYFASRSNLSKDVNYSFFDVYSKVATFFGFISIIFWILGPLMGIISSNCIVPNTWGLRQFFEGYYFIHFETQTITFFDNTIYRNTGFMCEAPVFNLLLCIALAYELFVNNKKHLIRKIILIATILSTLTTTGQLFLLLMLLMKLYNITKNNKKRKLLFWTLAPVMTIIVYNVSTIIMEEKMGTDSYESRSIVISNMMSSLYENPFFGVGINKYQTYDGQGLSNSLFHLMVDGGLYLTSIFLFYILYVPYKYKNKTGDIGWLFMNISFLLVFSITLDYNRLLDMAILGFAIANYKMYPKNKIQ